ncbi:MAG: hypothetical protein Q8K58_14035 [Acidimicrobiales bacterium]|nr:hypothetical protein [Acidimicrobiales bacterium]
MPRPSSPRSPIARAGLVVLATVLAVASACGSDDDSSGVADRRSDQVLDAATAAGLADEVADLLALAARGPTATFQITYRGTEGAEIIVYQEPPNRRADVVTNGRVVESRLLRDGVSYLCQPDPTQGSGSPLACRREAGALSAPGAFSDEALDAFAESLAGAGDDLELTVEERTIAAVEARCLVTAPKEGATLDGTGPTVDTLCVSPEGAQLLVDVEGDRVVASAYSTEVPEGTFEVAPAPPGDDGAS